MTTTPTVTVAIPAYNRAGMLVQALESCRRQTFRPFRVLISDNGSTEDLRAVAVRFSDLDVDFRRQDMPLTIAQNFQFGVDACETDLLKILCSDDILLPDALTEMVEAMRGSPDAGICVGGYIEFSRKDENSAPRIQKFVRPDLPRRTAFLRWRRLDNLSGSLFSACLYRTRALREIGGFDRGVEAAIDWEAYLALLARFPVVKVDGPVCGWRMHEEQYVKQMDFARGARGFRDVLYLTSPKGHPRPDRLGLSGAQRAYLRHQACWSALRNGLATRDGRGRNFQAWREMVAAAGMTVPLLLGAPLWAAAKLGEKLAARGRNQADAPWPEPAVQARTALHLREIFDGPAA